MSDAQQPPPINPYDPPASARPGMSGGAKVLLGVGIGCGVLMLLCCGFIGFSAYLVGRSFDVSDDAATIREVTDSIVSIDVPPGLEPQASVDWVMPFVNRKMFSIAIYANKEEESALVLFQIDRDFGSADAMKMQLEQVLQESGQGSHDEVEIVDAEVFETEINGGSAEFSVGKGKRENSDREVWQATGAFDGRGGPAMLLIQLDAEHYDKEQLMTALKSMK